MTRSFEPLFLGRSEVLQSGGKLSITIPAPSNVPVNLFMLAWLVAWTVGGFWAAGAFVNGPTNSGSGGMGEISGRLFLGAWLCGWLFGEIAVIYQLLWSFFGYENITLDLTSLSHGWSILGFGRAKRYELVQVKNLRTAAAPSNKLSSGEDSPPMDASCIAFDYGRGTVYMANSIDAGEATSIVEKILAFNRSLRPKER